MNSNISNFRVTQFMAHPIAIENNINPSFSEKFYLYLNNPYISFVVCSIIKLLFYILLYKIFISIKNYYTHRFTNTININ